MNCRSLLLILVAAAATFMLGCKSATTAPAPSRGSAPPVTAVEVVVQTMPVEIGAVGNVEAFSTITVKAQIGGELTKVYFQEGEYVKKGERLFLIDPRPYDEAIRQAEANLARDQALLRQAEATLQRDLAQQKYAQDQAARYQKLFEEGVMSKQQADQYVTDSRVSMEAVRADNAGIESARAAVQADAAALGNARLQRNYCEIYSPIDGRTGDLKLKQGNYVKAADVDLVTINQVQPIYVTFSVPEKELPAIKRYMSAGKLKVLATPPSWSEQPEAGVLTFVDNGVDQSTGTIKLKGTFANSATKLWPGQYVNARLLLTERLGAITVPAQAIQTGQTGDYVYVVKPDMTVEVRPVVSGLRVREQVVVEKGLERGEKVVTEGQLRLAPGTKVRLKGDRAS